MNGANLSLYTAVLLQDQYLIQMLEAGKYDDMHSVAKLQVAMCDALSEISTHFPVYMKKTLNKAADGSISSTSVSNGGAFTVTSVTAGGKPVPYTVDHSGLHIDGQGPFEITYVPEVFEVSVTDNFDVAPEVGFLMMMYLIARNYCMVSGRMEEAAMFDSRYSERVEIAKLKRKARIPARKFV